MQEVLSYLRANGFKTYIVTGGGQDFVRVYSEQTYGIPPEQVVGTAGGTTYSYDQNGKPILTKDPKLLLNDNNAGFRGHSSMIRRKPSARSTTQPETSNLEYTKAGDGRGWLCWCCTTCRPNMPMAPRKASRHQVRTFTRAQ
jgi:hypothetical protein